MPWDDLVNTVNKVETRVKIQESTHLDQHYLKRKWLLKMSLSSRDNQTDKKASQAKDKDNQVKQGSKAKKYSKKTRKKKRRKAIKDDANGLALPQPELMPLQLQVVRARKRKRRRRKPKMSLKLPAIVVTQRATIPLIVSSQKTSCSFGNLHVNNC